MRHFISSVMVITSIATFAQVGINTTNPQGIFNIDGKSSSATTNPETGTPTALQLSDDFIVMPDGRVGIGAIPSTSALLELDTSQFEDGQKKGFLGPRVALRSYNDSSTIPSPQPGLLVYNLGTEAKFNYVGYVFWNGSEWRTLSGESLAPGNIGALLCTKAVLTPNTYVKGAAYKGILKIPYTGGNGGVYASQSAGPVNGLTANLTAGHFSNQIGGELTYTITGIPSVSSPDTTTFPITIGGQNCSATIGSGTQLAPGEYQFFNYEIPASYVGLLSDHAAGGSLILGKIRIDVYFNASSNTTASVFPYIPRLYNISTSNIKLWFSAVSNVTNFMGGNILLAPGGYVNTDDGIYLNLGYNDISTSSPRNAITGSNPSQETETIDFVADGIWYRMTIFIVVDNKNTANDADNTRIINIVAQRMSAS